MLSGISGGPIGEGRIGGPSPSITSNGTQNIMKLDDEKSSSDDMNRPDEID